MGAHSPLEVEANGKRNYLTCVGSLSVVLIVRSTTMGSSLSVSSFTRIGSSVSANGSVILQGRLNSSGDVRGDRISATGLTSFGSIHRFSAVESVLLVSALPLRYARLGSSLSAAASANLSGSSSIRQSV